MRVYEYETRRIRMAGQTRPAAGRAGEPDDATPWHGPDVGRNAAAGRFKHSARVGECETVRLGDCHGRTLRPVAAGRQGGKGTVALVDEPSR